MKSLKITGLKKFYKCMPFKSYLKNRDFLNYLNSLIKKFFLTYLIVLINIKTNYFHLRFTD